MSKAEEQLQEVISECYADPLKFVYTVFDWGYDELDGEVGPDDWQCGVLSEIRDHVLKVKFNGRDSVAPLKIAVASGHDIGKSTCVAWVILWIMSTRPYCRGTVTANKLPQLESKTWPELAKWWRLAINRHWFDWTGGRNNLKFYHKKYPDVWNCFGLSSNEENSESFAGQHAKHSTSFYIFDEASGISDIIRGVAEGGLADGEPMLFAFGNPTKNTGWFYEACFGKMKHRYISRSIDSREVKISNKGLIQEWLDDFGEDSDYFRVRARGLPPRMSDCQFNPMDLVSGAVNRFVEPDIGSGVIVGVDVARFGSNKTIILTREGLDARKIPMEKYHGLDTMQVADRVARHLDIYKPDACFIDDAGVGGGVVDRLNQLNYRVNGVNVGSKPNDTNRYANLRAEIWDKMREWLSKGSIPDDRALIDGLTAPEYGFNKSNKLQIESKKDMLRRGIDSPDEADALAMTFSRRVRRRDLHSRILEFAKSDYKEFT